MLLRNAEWSSVFSFSPYSVVEKDTEAGFEMARWSETLRLGRTQLCDLPTTSPVEAELRPVTHHPHWCIVRAA